jgi:cytochrome b6-f complex iron-sulfur subunit
VRRRATGARRFVDALLRNRRPPRFEADPEEARMLQVAAALRGARPATDLPSEEFVSRLERRLRSELEAAPPPARGLPSRRRFLLGGGLAAAAVAAGVATDVSLHHGDEQERTQEELVPVAGGWTTVATLADLADGRPRRFLAGSVQGVLIPGADGRVHALSAVCTHLGCLLQPQARGLLCPCHGARFDLRGMPLNREYLAPLPRLRSRVVGDEVQVLAV